MTPARLTITDGSIEALKYFALLLMTVDHVNKYLFNGTKDWMFSVGRLCLPIFVFVLAYNLSRPGTLENGVYLRAIKRLLIFGVIATVPYTALGGLVEGWWPLNVLFTLCTLTATLYLIQLPNIWHKFAGVIVFIVGGSMVEFWWPALVFGVAVWSYYRRASWPALLVALLAISSLWYINGSFWALTALPVIFLATQYDCSIPRLRWVFYAYYPLHLAGLWLIRIPMRDAGYLFF